MKGLVLVERVKDADMVQFTVLTLSPHCTTSSTNTSTGANSNDDSSSGDQCDVWMIRTSYDDIKRQISDVWDYGDDHAGSAGSPSGANDKYLEHFENAILNNNSISISATNSDEISIEFSYLDESSSPSLFKRVVPIHQRGCSHVLYAALESVIQLCRYTRARQVASSSSSYHHHYYYRHHYYCHYKVPSELSKRKIPEDSSDHQHHDDDKPNTKKAKRHKATSTLKNRGVHI